jgi:DNA-directed RNA polymerase specialized sigma24 family protein
MERYRRSQQCDEAYCVELFRRALIEHDEAAWHALYVQYENLVNSWVRAYADSFQDKHPEDFVNEAFARMWQYGIKPNTAERLDGLGKCLAYLKKCAWSSVEDHHRWREKDALSNAKSLGDWLDLHGAERSIEDSVVWEEIMAQLRHLLEETVHTNEDRLVAEESWVYAQTPREIHSRYPEIFASADDVSRLKHNILKRLQRRIDARDSGISS